MEKLITEVEMCAGKDIPYEDLPNLLKFCKLHGYFEEAEINEETFKNLLNAYKSN